MIHIDNNTIEPLIQKARISSRKRKNLNFHDGSADTLQRMLHAMEPGTYVQPHKHQDPDKREAFIILLGKVMAIEYDDSGKVIDHFIMEPAAGRFGIEFPARSWHSLICLQSSSVVYEVKDGPWDPADDKFFATWAPKEGDPSCGEFIERVLKEIGI
jgi:cupin fold WbuC family metalloprotein